MSVGLQAHRPGTVVILCLLLVAGPLLARSPASSPGWAGKTSGKLDVPAAPIDPAVLVSTAARLRQFLGVPGRAKPAGPAPDPSDPLPGWHLTRNERNGTPVFLSGPTPPASAAKSAAPLSRYQGQALALDFIESHRRLFRLEHPQAELEHAESVADPGGGLHVAFQQHCRGIPLWGCDLVVHLLPDGSPYAINARCTPTLQRPPDLVPTIDADQAVRHSLNHLGATTPAPSLSPSIRKLLAYDGPIATQYLWLDPTTQRPHLVWQVEIRPTLRDRWFCFVDAHTGKILEAYNTTPSQGSTTATALDLAGRQQTINVYQLDDAFYLLDASRPSAMGEPGEILDRQLRSSSSITPLGLSLPWMLARATWACWTRSSTSSRSTTRGTIRWRSQLITTPAGFSNTISIPTTAWG